MATEPAASPTPTLHRDAQLAMYRRALQHLPGGTDSNFRALSRQSVKTYLTHTIMRATQARNGGGKWVVLTDQESTNTFRGMAGISETEGGIGLRIEEVGPDQNLHLDIGEHVQVGRWDAQGQAQVRYRGTAWQARHVGPGVPAPGEHRIRAIDGNRLLLERVAH